MIKSCTATHRLDEGWSKGVINVTDRFGYALNSRTEDMFSHTDT